MRVTINSIRSGGKKNGFFMGCVRRRSWRNGKICDKFNSHKNCLSVSDACHKYPRRNADWICGWNCKRKGRSIPKRHFVLEDGRLWRIYDLFHVFTGSVSSV